MLVSHAHGVKITYRLVGPGDKMTMEEVITELNRRLAQEVDELSPQEGKAQQKEALGSFFVNRHDSHLLSTTQGGGKTHDTAIELANLKHEVRALALAPSHANLLEFEAMYKTAGGTSSMIRRGRAAKAEHGEPMCDNLEAVGRHAQMYGPKGIGRNVCTACPFRKTCKYYEQFKEMQNKQVVFAPHNFAYTPLTGKGGWTPDIVICDEYPGAHALHIKATMPSILGMSLTGSTEYQWQGILDKHMETIPDYGDPSSFREHRERSEILNALLKPDHDVFFYNGKWHLPEWREYLYKAAPLLLLDGTANKMMCELTMRSFDKIHTIRIKRNLRVTQVIGNRFANSNVVSDPAMLQWVNKVVSEKADVNTGFVTTLALRKVLNKLTDPQWMHFGALRGRNDLKHCTALHMFGQQTPPPEMVRCQASFICRQFGWPVPDSDSVLTKRDLKTRKGKPYQIEFWEASHPLVQAMTRVAREAECAQGADRIRATLHEGDPKELVIYGEVDHGIPVDRVLRWHDVKNGREGNRVEHALESGPIPKSPKQAAEMRSDVWNSQDTAKRDYAAMPDGWQDGLIGELADKPGGGRRISMLRKP
jgi:hypothetical protein